VPQVRHFLANLGWLTLPLLLGLVLSHRDSASFSSIFNSLNSSQIQDILNFLRSL
jgi:hypothetical protein